MNPHEQKVHNEYLVQSMPTALRNGADTTNG